MLRTSSEPQNSRNPQSLKISEISHFPLFFICKTHFFYIPSQKSWPNKITINKINLMLSRPPRACELKRPLPQAWSRPRRSRPPRACELKLDVGALLPQALASRPPRACELKLRRGDTNPCGAQSRPPRACELKPARRHRQPPLLGHAPRGRVN